MILVLWIAGFWGFAEATFFFLVPDVWLSYLAIESLPQAIAASLYALAGALNGGAIMWWLGLKSPADTRRFLARIPAIAPSLIAKVGEQIEERGLIAVMMGPLKGIPYKIYAVELGARRRSLVSFLLTSIPARYLRFAFAVGAFWAAGQVLPFALRGKRISVTVFWIVFYWVYFRAWKRKNQS